MNKTRPGLNDVAGESTGAEEKRAPANSATPSAVRDQSFGRRLNGFHFGLVLALGLGAVFIWTRLDELPVNFQIDGQVPEFLGWAASPQTAGSSLNPELNERLYSFYYVTLGRLAGLLNKMDILRLFYAVEILAICAAVYFFVHTLTRDRWAALLAVTATIWHDATSIALGGSGGIGLICGPLFPATALALLAMALSWRRQHVAAAFVAGVSFNVHGSSALFVSAMVLFAAWLDGRKTAPDGTRRPLSATAIRAALVCLCAAAPTVIWIALDPPPASTLSTEAWLRFPHWVYPYHMFISTTPAKAWAMLFLFVLPGILGLAFRPKVISAQMAVFWGWIIAAALLLTIGYVFVEWIPVRLIAQMTFWRGTRYLVLLCLAFGLSHLLRCIREGGVVALAGALTMVAYVTPRYPELAWIGHVGLIGLLLVAAYRVRGYARLLPAAVAGVVFCLVIYEASAFLPQLGAHLHWRWPVIVAGLVALFLWAGRLGTWTRHTATLTAMVAVSLWLADLGIGKHFPASYRKRAAALLDLAPAIREACPPGKTVIAPPDMRNPGAWADRGSFLCRQQLTAYAYGPWLAVKILDRMQWYLDTPVEQLPPDRSVLPKLIEGYRTRTNQQFADLNQRYDVRLAIVERDRPLGFKTVAQNDVFTVYDLDAPVP